MKPAQRYVEVPAPLPDSLIHHPCSPVGAGDSVKSLQKGYLANITCIGKYKAVVDSIQIYNRELKNVGE